MIDKFNRIPRIRLLVAGLAVVATGLIGSYLLGLTHAQTPADTKPAIALLRPVSLGTAPYQYIAYSGSLDQTRAQTGIQQYFAAFIISSSPCTPAWGGGVTNGLNSQRSAEISADFERLRAAGGEAAVSFGGSNGTELAASCRTATELTAAYKQVIDTYHLKRMDFDIEGQTLDDTDANSRRADAIAGLQRQFPGLEIWLTLPVRKTGLTPAGLSVIKQMRDRGIVLAGINIMAMNYNFKSNDMGGEAIRNAEASFGQLQKIYPDIPPAQIWKALGITVMVGHNNTLPETFTLADAAKLRSFAESRGVGMLSIWNAGRDIACPEGTPADQPSTGCSGVQQQPYDFLRALSIPPRK